MRHRRALLLAFTFACMPRAIHAQTAAPATNQSCNVTLGRADLVSPTADLLRVSDAASSESRRSFFIRRWSDHSTVDVCALPGAARQMTARLALPAEQDPDLFALLPASSRIVVNTGYPRDWNDGAIWSGRGVSAGLTAGALFRWRRVEAAVAPVIAASQNASFDTHEYPDAAYSPWIDRWHGRYIDLPQRPGADRQARIDPGQSYVRIAASGWRAGVSTEAFAWGPARRNALLLSGTGGGFPHAFIGTARPHDIRIGTAELQVFWARLTESDYFDYNPANNKRAMAGVIATFRPRGLDGLYLGAARLNTRSWSGNTVADLIAAPFTGAAADSSGLPQDLRLYGLFARWVAAPSGFEVYGEWARQNSWEQWFRPFNRADASYAYTLGLQQFVRRGATAVRFSAEITRLSDALANREVGRGVTTFYVSPAVTQGHTHRGQSLGAPIGPGSEAQYIGADVFWRAGRTGFSIERVRYDEDAYAAVWMSAHEPHGHDTELSFRGNHIIAFDHVSIDAEFGYSFRYNRSLLGLHHVNYAGFPYRRDSNFELRIGARWIPPGLRPQT